MRVLITGANGQVGWELHRTAPTDVIVIALDKETLDICDPACVDQMVREHQPDVIINTAAYTAVDKAESEPELAFAINRDGAANLARAAHTHGARLIHISTDFVFDGKKSSPYFPGDIPSPLSVYGASKLAGEIAATSLTAGQVLIIRTAWVYSAHGNNFVKTILRLLNERDELRVVSDQIGTPTWAKGLAEIIWEFARIKKAAQGIYHWTDAGVASWYDFAVAIQELGMQNGLLDKRRRIIPITSAEYPTAALRPSYGVLAKAETQQCLGRDAATHWRDSLALMLAEVAHLKR